MTRGRKSTKVEQALELLTERGFEGMAEALKILLNEAMKIERDDFLGCGPYERSSERRGYANGYKKKTMKSRVGCLDLDIPQVRDVEDGERFYPRSLERGIRSERALKLALAEMYIKGVSTRQVAAITRELCGFDVSNSQVSRASAELDEELESWRRRPLGRFDFIILDARYEKVRHGGCVVSCAVLTAIGIDQDRRRQILGVSVKLSEAEVHWREFLSSLVERGLHGVQYLLSDDHEGLRAAREAVFPGVPWQRCQVHLQRNAVRYVPRKELRAGVAEGLRSVFGASNRSEAERQLREVARKYEKKAPRLSSWIEEAVPEGLSVFELPMRYRRRLRSTNLLEWVNKEIKRRTAVATLFPNEASLLRLVTAILVEISEEWETGRRYLPKPN
jgi:transposase-like protein